MWRSILFVFLLLWSVSGQSHLIQLKGYLGKEEFERAREDLKQAEKEGDARIVLQICSSSGDLEQALLFAYELDLCKVRSKKKIVVYIQGRAIGPAALFPFLSDELFVTPLVAWGDLTYRKKGEISRSLLATTVKQLICGNTCRGDTLLQLVDPMIDGRYQIAESAPSEESVHSREREAIGPLILNRSQLESLELISLDQVISDREFAEKEGAIGSLEQEERKKSIDELVQKLSSSIRYDPNGENRIGYLTIGRERPIDQSTYLYVKFALEFYKKEGVSFVLLHLNTPGGEVLPSLKIVDLLQKLDIHSKIPIVAFIDNWAVSAGAMLAYASRFIGVVPTSLMGAAEPVFAGSQGEMQSAPEKVHSVLRTEFANLANFYGRDPLIAQAMVDKDLILATENGKTLRLKNEREISQKKIKLDQIITEKGKLLTLNAKELLSLQVADFSVPLGRTPPLTEKEKEEGVWPAKKSAVFLVPFFAKIPHAKIIEYRDWRLSFFSFLSHPMISGLLLMGFIIGLYVEINTPGFGIPGAIGVGCLALIFLSSFANEAIHWIEVILLLAGIVLLLLEFFVIPGFGIPGILGIVLTVIGLFALMLPSLDQFSLFDPGTFALIGVTFFKQLGYLCGALILAVLAIVLLARCFSHRFFRFSKLVLIDEQESGGGEHLSRMSGEEMPGVGEIGESLTPLRPSGKVHIGENLFDAMTQGNYIDAYVAVEVVRVEGSKVVVKRMVEQGEESK